MGAGGGKPGGNLPASVEFDPAGGVVVFLAVSLSIGSTTVLLRPACGGMGGLGGVVEFLEASELIGFRLVSLFP